MALAIGAALAAAVVTFISAPAAKAADLVRWTEPDPPAFTLAQLGAAPDATFSLTAQSGDAILVHFFASWCEPCREELPALQRLAARGAPGVRVVAIAVADNEAALRRLVDATGIAFPILMDSDRAVARAWSISALPSTVVLDSRHRPRLIVESDFAWDTIAPQALIEQLSSPATNSSLARNVQQMTATQGGP